MNDRPCATCAARSQNTEVRDNFITKVDTTLGLTPIGNELYACPVCGMRYRRTVDEATRFHDYDQYFFSKLDGPAPAFGCARCAGEDAAAAWEAMQSKRGPSLVQESHFSIRITGCSCGQAFGVVFTERMDFNHGEDEQNWLAVPLTLEERSRLTATSEAELPKLVTELGRERRFLVRSYPPGSGISVGWRTGGFMIGPHD